MARSAMARRRLRSAGRDLRNQGRAGCLRKRLTSAIALSGKMGRCGGPFHFLLNRQHARTHEFLIVPLGQNCRLLRQRRN
jgi:hypothetical protein